MLKEVKHRPRNLCPRRSGHHNSFFSYTSHIKQNQWKQQLCSSFLSTGCLDKKWPVADIYKYLIFQQIWPLRAMLDGRLPSAWAGSQDTAVVGRSYEPWVSLHCRQLLEETHSQIHHLTAWQNSACYPWAAVLGKPHIHSSIQGNSMASQYYLNSSNFLAHCMYFPALWAAGLCQSTTTWSTLLVVS